MQIIDSVGFENVYLDCFGSISRNTLSGVNHKRLRFDLGGSLNDFRRIPQAKDRSFKLILSCLACNSLWLRIILWEDSELENLNLAGFNLGKSSISFKGKYEGENILYLNFDSYNEAIIAPIIECIINRDMNIEPNANITCYFINFDKKIICNIYDDRGLDIVCKDEDQYNILLTKYGDWLSS